MTPSVEKLDLDEIERLLAAATPRPWKLGGSNGRSITTPGGYVGDGFLADVDTLDNALAIVRILNNASAIVSELRSLRAEVERAREDAEALRAEAERWGDGRLMATVRALYRSEINCAVSTFWDGGMRVRLGDEVNGWAADAEFDIGDDREAGAWLREQAVAHFPNSGFALAAPSSAGAGGEET